MVRIFRKKFFLFLAVSCAVTVSLNVFGRLSTAHNRLFVSRILDMRDGPPVFLISDSRTHTFVFRERSFVEKNSTTNVKQPESKNSTRQENTSEETEDNTLLDASIKQTKTVVVVAVDDARSIKKDVNDSMVPTTTHVCPEKPPFLEGALAAMNVDVSPSELIVWYPTMEKGGRLRPIDCIPRQRLAIVIPYRNRYPHLHIMLNNLIPILQRQQADVTFFVIEQALPGTFNRGALLNVGFLEAEKIASFDCYIFHDVDMIPLNDHNFYRCGDNPRHFAVAMNKFGYKLYYKNYFGAVVGFSKKQFETINGCSNMYFGWGGEDDDLLARLRNKNYTMQRYNYNTARYDMIKHTRDSGNEENPLRKALRNDALQRQDVEGLNTIRYKVNSIRIEHLYTWINVTLNMTDILKTAPEFTLQILKTQMNKSKLTQEQHPKQTNKTKTGHNTAI